MSAAAVLWLRKSATVMEMQVEISTEHSDYFTRNLVAVRAEKRLALITKRANSFVTGTFTTSP